MKRPRLHDEGLDAMEAYDLSSTAQTEQEPTVLRDPNDARNEEFEPLLFRTDLLDDAYSNSISSGASLVGTFKNRRTGKVSEEICEQIAIERSEIAFQEFYDIVAPKMYLLLRRMLRTEDDALDVMQETFIRLWNKAPVLYKIHTNLGAWSHHLARNIALDEIKSKHYKHMKTSESFDPEMFEDLFTDDRTPDGTIAESESRIELRKALAKLTPEEQKGVELIFFRGYSQKQAAEKMGLPIGKFSTLFRNALAELEYELVPRLGAREAPHRPLPESYIRREKKKEAKDHGRLLEEAMQATAHIVLKRPLSPAEERAAAIEKFTSS